MTNPVMITRPEPRDAMDKWLDKNGYYSDLHSVPIGPHGKKYCGMTVGSALLVAEEMGALSDDEYIGPDEEEVPSC